jgi:hypothetical protein
MGRERGRPRHGGLDRLEIGRGKPRAGPRASSRQRRWPGLLGLLLQRPGVAEVDELDGQYNIEVGWKPVKEDSLNNLGGKPGLELTSGCGRSTDSPYSRPLQRSLGVMSLQSK